MRKYVFITQPNFLVRLIHNSETFNSRNLQIHHIQHWADGGTTSINNGVCVCSSCHTRLHEGGYTIQRVDEHEQWLNEQFNQQRHADDISLFDFERKLRDNRVSFDEVRKLSPTRYRFRVIDAQGRDLRGAGYVSKSRSTHNNHSTRMECKTETLSAAHPSNQKAHTATKSAAEPIDASHSIRVESGEWALFGSKDGSSEDYGAESCKYNHAEPSNTNAEFTDDEEFLRKNPWEIAESHAVYRAIGT